MSVISNLKTKLLLLLPYWLFIRLKTLLNRFRNRKSNTIAGKIEDLRTLFIYNHPIHQVPPATGRLRLLQEADTILLKMFSDKCAEHGLRYWLDYGTLLGAVRHKGFIPWDDDTDLCMMKAEYEKLWKLLPSMFPKAEGFTWKRHGFIQIGYKDTAINLDVFPHHFHSETFSDECRDNIAKSITGVRKKINFVHGKVSLTNEEITELINKEILNGKPELPESEKPLIFTSPVFDCNKAIDYDTIFPLKKIAFEGHLFSAPNRPRKRLSMSFGDFMAYPSTFVSQHFHMENLLKSEALISIICEFIDKYENR